MCTKGVDGNECETDGQSPELTTTFSIYRRHVSIATSRSNFSILSMDRLDEPLQDTSLDVEGLKEAFNWLFNFSAAGIPAPASIAEYFWTVPGQLQSEYWSIEPYQIFQSILAFPFWQFNPNNFGNVNLSPTDIVPGLPPDFYTIASIGNPYEKIVVNRYAKGQVQDSVLTRAQSDVYLVLCSARSGTSLRVRGNDLALDN